MQDYYAARAPEYDRVYEKPERQADLRAIEAWLPPRFAGKRVLEVACGTGWWTRFIAPVASEVVALDAAPETLAIARARLGDGARVQWIVGDAYDLPRPREPYDAAFAGFWLSHVPVSRRRSFLAGLHAALRDGATVVLLDNRYVEGSSTRVAERDAEGNGYQLRRLDDGTTHRVLKNFPDEAELRAMVSGVAAHVDVVTWPHYWALAYTVAHASAGRAPDRHRR